MTLIEQQRLIRRASQDHCNALRNGGRCHAERPCRWRPEPASIRRRMPAGSLLPALALAGRGVSTGLPMLS